MSTEIENVAGAAELPEGLALMKIETEAIMAVAARRERKPAEIVAKLQEQVRLFPAFAEQALYSRPVGKEGVCVSCRRVQADYKARACESCGANVMQRPIFATGLSIRAAEAIAEAYGFNSVRTTATPMGPDMVNVTAVFLDYQNGRRWEKNALVSRRQKRRDGSFYTLSDERFALLCDATASKVIREAIVRSVPPGLRAALETACRNSVRLDSEKVAKIVAAFAARRVPQDRLEQFLGRPAPEWTNEDRIKLLELDTALRDGETTVEEVFGLGEPETPAPQENPAPTSTAERAKRKLAARAAPAPAEAPAPDDGPWDPAPAS